MDITSINQKFYEDADYQDTKSEVRSTSKSKVFQCTGYGDCDMVFTRSEHLARHMRKHTGEKPFQCIVPGCERMFSRYDNMMQHTQTHNKSRGTLRRIKTKTTSKKIRGNNNTKKNSFTSSHRGSSSDEYSDDFGPLPSPPPSRRGSSRDLSSALNNNNKVKYNHSLLVDEDDDDDDMMDSGDDEYRPPTSSSYYHQHHHQRPLSPPSHHPLLPVRSNNSINNNYHHQPPYYQQPYRYEGWYPPINTTPIATLPPSRCPDSPISSESSGSRSSSDHITTELTKHRRRSMPQVYYHPYPYQPHHSEKQQLVPILPRRSSQESVLPQLACYLMNHPNALPESYVPKVEPKIHRRLSLQDLSNPIESLKDSSEDQTEEVGIDLTEDEFQAIQGFGQFCRAAVTCTK